MIYIDIKHAVSYLNIIPDNNFRICETIEIIHICIEQNIIYQMKFSKCILTIDNLKCLLKQLKNYGN